MEIIQILEASRTDLNNAIKGLSEAQSRTALAADQWSILQCVEHVIAVEERFVGRINEAERTESPRIDPDREAELATRAYDRSERRQAPEAVHPKGRFTSLAQAVEIFNSLRDNTIRVVKSKGDDLYSISIEHPRFGVMNGVEVLRIIAGHSSRHAEQIREISSSASAKPHPGPSSSPA